MAKSIQSALADIQAVLDGPTHYSYTQFAHASVNLTSAIAWLNNNGVPVLNLKLSASPVVTLDLVEEV